jgi:hypothetical protein
MVLCSVRQVAYKPDTRDRVQAVNNVGIRHYDSDDTAAANYPEIPFAFYQSG